MANNDTTNEVPDIRISDDYAKAIVAEEQAFRRQKKASKTATQMLAEYAAQLAVTRQFVRAAPRPSRKSRPAGAT